MLLKCVQQNNYPRYHQHDHYHYYHALDIESLILNKTGCSIVLLISPCLHATRILNGDSMSSGHG